MENGCKAEGLYKWHGGMAVRRVVNGLICNGPGWRVGQDKTSVLGEHTHTHREMGRVVLVSPVLA